MIAAVDQWLAKKLFHPVIIRMCWLLNRSQHWIANHLYWIGSLAMLYYAMNDGEVILAVIWGFISIIETIKTGLSPNHEGVSYTIVRYLLLVCWVFLGVGTALGKGVEVLHIAFMLILVSEYARTIETIPPKPTKEKKEQLRVSLT